MDTTSLVANQQESIRPRKQKWPLVPLDRVNHKQHGGEDMAQLAVQ
jgi:hypothetical protein